MIPLARLNEKNNQIATLQAQITQLTPQAAQADQLVVTNQNLSNQIAQSQAALTQYQAIAGFGFTDPRSVQSWEREWRDQMATRQQKDQVPLDQFVQGAMQNPDTLSPPMAAFVRSRVAAHVAQVHTPQPGQQPAQTPGQPGAPAIPAIPAPGIAGVPGQGVQQPGAPQFIPQPAVDPRTGQYGPLNQPQVQQPQQPVIPGQPGQPVQPAAPFVPVIPGASPVPQVGLLPPVLPGFAPVVAPPPTNAGALPTPTGPAPLISMAELKKITDDPMLFKAFKEKDPRWPQVQAQAAKRGGRLK